MDIKPRDPLPTVAAGYKAINEAQKPVPMIDYIIWLTKYEFEEWRRQRWIEFYNGKMYPNIRSPARHCYEIKVSQ